jgi:hypothetical protein
MGGAATRPKDLAGACVIASARASLSVAGRSGPSSPRVGPLQGLRDVLGTLVRRRCRCVPTELGWTARVDTALPTVRTGDSCLVRQLFVAAGPPPAGRCRVAVAVAVLCSSLSAILMFDA